MLVRSEVACLRGVHSRQTGLPRVCQIEASVYRGLYLQSSTGRVNPLREVVYGKAARRWRCMLWSVRVRRRTHRCLEKVVGYTTAKCYPTVRGREGHILPRKFRFDSLERLKMRLFFFSTKRFLFNPLSHQIRFSRDCGLPFCSCMFREDLIGKEF